jgi:predicted nucleotidyltransferase
MEIQSLPIRQIGVRAVYGFRSFFRGEPFRDVDLAIVLSESISDEMSTYYRLKAEIDSLGVRLVVQFHLSVLTEAEFDERPLRDMNQLIFLSGTIKN